MAEDAEGGGSEYCDPKLKGSGRPDQGGTLEESLVSFN
jgi:hypothetical protein